MSDANNAAPAPAQPVANAAETQPAAAQPAPAQEAPKAEQKPAPRVFARKPAPPVQEPAKVEAQPEAARKRISDGALTRMRNELESAKKNASEAESLRQELALYAKKELESAPEKARKYVLAKHKDDPRAQLAELRALRDSGLLDEPKPSLVDIAAANTAPPKAPAADTTDPDVQAAQKYRELAANPAQYLVARSFLSKNRASIDRGEKKLAAKN